MDRLIMFSFLLLLLFGTCFPSALWTDPCNWPEDGDNNALPELYEELGSDKCPAPLQFQHATMDCEFQLDPEYPEFSKDRKCDSFCQVRTTFGLGREQPFLSTPYCKQGLVACGITNGTKQTYTWPKTPGGKIQVFDKGIDGGYHGWFDGVAVAPDMTVAPDPDGCGYFTFIPFTKEVCGTETEGFWTVQGNPPDCSHDFWSTQNMCVSELQKGRASDAWETGEIVRGVTVFVRTKCDDRSPALATKQVSGYVMDGVAMPETEFAAYVDYWVQLERSNYFAINPSKAQCDSDAENPYAIDCADALEIALDRAGTLVDYGTGASAPQYSTIAELFTCAIRVVFSESVSADKECNISYLEVVAAAQKVMDRCAQADVVGGIHVIRDKGDCARFVSLENAALRDDKR